MSQRSTDKLRDVSNVFGSLTGVGGGEGASVGNDDGVCIGNRKLVSTCKSRECREDALHASWQGYMHKIECIRKKLLLTGVGGSVGLGVGKLVGSGVGSYFKKR